MANFDQILSELLFRWRNRCNLFSGILDKNYGFYGNQYRPSTYNGNTVALVLSIFFILAGNKNNHKSLDIFWA